MKKGGFTIVELLVVIAVIGTISGFMVINFRKGEANARLQRSAQQIVQNIRKAQNMTLSSVEHDGEIPYAYGVYFEKQIMTSYILFFDDNKNYKYDGSDEGIGEPIPLEKGIKIEDISAPAKLHIAFIPPDSFVEFNSNPSVTDVTITIKKEGGTCPQDCRYIEINNKGWMSIKSNP